MHRIAVIPGDGIGPEVIEQALLVLDKVSSKFGVKFEYVFIDAGGCAIDKFGVPIREEDLDLVKKCSATLLGAVGGPKWDTLPGNLRPEQALLKLRGGLKVYANLRPAVLYDELKDSSPLKKEIVNRGIDILVVRELIGGMYFGPKGREKRNGEEVAYDTEIYSTSEIERIARVAFEAARKRKKKVTSVDKANILESSRLWREVVERLAKEYPDVELSHMYVDNASMQLVKDPSQFDVILTSNMFGDILSDEASMIVGSIGMLASASLGEGRVGLYEPIHGTAPDIAGQDLANPIATILSAAMMLRYSFDMEDAAIAVENAVKIALKEGYRTRDIYTENCKLVGTKQMGKIICENI
ncbi:3-isopropylmalate dehydrogenase [Caldicellulosiruptor morganii]|uniref:3-isopropylmalate dehydrogenase n=1 Tax=Caldicellulosiruptor morganii TaxID=1387555 RepID=A0ABY7BNB2_9FIRM|nr:3-isopropylmalate dehydrogenase [Caldicellulosiruptor morganii]WAM33377.1 3-isopropylmalate dehydrogenase [Caldicellulosiruptor morganii]